MPPDTKITLRVDGDNKNGLGNSMRSEVGINIREINVNPKECMPSETVVLIEADGHLSDESIELDLQEIICYSLAHYLLSGKSTVVENFCDSSESALIASNELTDAHQVFSYVANAYNREELTWEDFYDVMSTQWWQNKEGVEPFNWQSAKYQWRILKERFLEYKQGLSSAAKAINGGHNQDRALTFPNGGAVIDGVSSGVHSAIVADVLMNTMKLYCTGGFLTEDYGFDQTDVSKFIRRILHAVGRAQDALQTKIVDNPDWNRQDAATFAAYSLRDGEISVAVIGDCRVFGVGRGALVPYNEPDDSVRSYGINLFDDDQREVIRDVLERFEGNDTQFANEAKRRLRDKFPMYAGVREANTAMANMHARRTATSAFSPTDGKSDSSWLDTHTHNLGSDIQAVIAMSDGLLKHLSRQEVFEIIDHGIKKKKDADSIITDILNAVTQKFKRGYLDDISISLTLLPQKKTEEQEQGGFWNLIKMMRG